MAMAAKHKKFIIQITGVIFIMALVLSSVFSYLWFLDNRMQAFARNGVIRIRPNTTIEELEQQVQQNLSPLHEASIRRVFDKENVALGLRPGSYAIDSTYSAHRFARAITRGWEEPVNLVLSGRIRSVDDVADRISSQMMVDKEQMLSALKDSLLLAGYGFTPSRVFEMIIPDTYQMYWSASVEDILDRMKKEYDAYWTEERVTVAARQGLTPSQVSILASIIAEESHYKDEYPKIASVYLTRLRSGMKLQACPTVCYIYDYKINRVLNRHLATKSPYNTYMYAGLPPTPICVPDKAHLDAVLHPDSTPYRYFCADSQLNGRNVFSVSLSEHNKKAALYHTALEKYLKNKELKEQAEAENVTNEIADET